MSSKFGGPFLPFPRWAMPMLVGDSIAKAVLLQFLMHMNAETQSTTTSYKYVADQVGVDRRTVMRATKRLEAIGVLVKKTRRTSNKTDNLTNIYWIRFDNPQVVSQETPGVVTLETLGSVTGDTRGGDTGDTTLVSRESPKQEYINKNINKSNRTKKAETEYEDVEVDRRAR